MKRSFIIIHVLLLCSFFVRAQEGVVTTSFNLRSGGNIGVEQITDLTFSVTATPSDGYAFLSWSDGVTDNPRIYTHNTSTGPYNDQTLYAVFVKTADVEMSRGNVSVSISSSGNASTQPTYSLTAIANDGATFYLWNNGVATNSTNYSETDGQRIPFFVSNVGDIFLSYVQHPGGVVSADPTGTPLEYAITATPATGYSFHSWEDGETANPRIYTHNTQSNPFNDKKFYAIFTKDADVTFSGGHVDVTVDSPTQPSFTLAAVAQDGVNCAASFYLWNNGANTPSVSYVEADGQRIPYFARENMLIYEKDEQDGNLVNVDALECGYTLTAVPVYNYHFMYWDDDHSNTNPVRDVDYIAETYIAKFGLSPFKVGDDYYPTYAPSEAVAVVGNTPIEVVSDVTDEVVVSQNVQIDGNNHIMANLSIPLDKKLTLADNLQVNNFFMEATTGSSSQLVNKSYLASTNAFIDIKLEANASVASPDKWYAFSVPFEVDVETGIRRQNAPTVPCVSATDYLVWEYDGTLRASTGNGWRKMLGGTLYPGRFYMIGIDGTQNTWRFIKRSGAALGGDATVALEQFPTADPGNVIDCGWNAVGNSTLQYASASIAGIDYVQVYDNNQSRYMPKLLSETSFVVAAPFFVQTASANTMYLSASNETNPDNLFAPKRLSTDESGDNDVYKVRFTDGSDDEDVFFLTSRPDAEYRYVIGRDVVKLMGGNNNPYIYATAYGQMLCAMDAPTIDDMATCPLVLYAPVAGEYHISASEGSRNLYLMYRGSPVTILNGSDYTLTLPRGASRDYALLLGSPRQVATDIPVQHEDGEVQPFKYLDNGILYIIKDGVRYDATGRLIQ